MEASNDSGAAHAAVAYILAQLRFICYARNKSAGSLDVGFGR